MEVIYIIITEQLDYNNYLQMWKPWILAAIGSIVMLNVSANSFSSSYDVADFEDSAVSSFDLSNYRCKDEIEKACGAKVNQ